MKKLVIAVALMLGMVSCGGGADTSNEGGVATVVSGSFRNCGADTLYLERFDATFSAVERVAESPIAEDGAFMLNFDVEDEGFYRITFDNDARPVVLVIMPGDSIKLAAEGDVFKSYTVEGSEESALVSEFNHTYFGYCDALATIFSNAEQMTDDVAQECYKLATAAMQAQVKFVGEHGDKLASFYVINHDNVEDMIPALYGKGINALHHRSLLESLQNIYSDSPVVEALRGQVEEYEAIVRLEESMSEISYPNIDLADSYRRSYSLSDLDGNVVILYFWASDIVSCLELNSELKDLYAKYHDAGLEIYQVAGDLDRSLWIQTLRQQQLPWISVYGGDNIEVFATYNVAIFPTLYIIDRNGDITPIEADVDAIERKVVKLL